MVLQLTGTTGRANQKAKDAEREAWGVCIYPLVEKQELGDGETVSKDQLTFRRSSTGGNQGPAAQHRN